MSTSASTGKESQSSALTLCMVDGFVCIDQRSFLNIISLPFNRFFSFNFSDSYLPANWALRRQQREDIEEDEYVTVSVGGMVIVLTLVMMVVTVMSLVSVMVVVLEREDIEEGECVTVCLEVGAG